MRHLFECILLFFLSGLQCFCFFLVNLNFAGMEGLKPPSELSFVGNVAENWRKWRRAFENYLLAINLVVAPVPEGGQVPAGNPAILRRQLAILLHTTGEEAYEVYSQFEYGPGENANDFATVIEKFEAYCNPRQNILYEWFLFWNLKQGEGENVDSYVKRLRTQAGLCEFGELRDRMLLFRLVFGITDVKLKERLLRIGDLTLAQAMDNVRASEMTKIQMSAIAEGDKTSAAVNTVGNSQDEATTVNAVVSKSRKPSTANPNHAGTKIKQCRFCGFDHLKGKCPAYGKECRKCSRRNHFASRCPEKSVNDVERGAENRSVDSLFVGTVLSQRPPNSWTCTLVLGAGDSRKPVSFKVDSGAEADILPISVAQQLPYDLLTSSTRLVGYGHSPISNLGKMVALVDHRGVSKSLEFEVVDSISPLILGLKSD